MKRASIWHTADVRRRSWDLRMASRLSVGGKQKNLFSGGEGIRLALPHEVTGKTVWKHDSRVDAIGSSREFNIDRAGGMRLGGLEMFQRAEMRLDGNGCEAGLCGVDSGDDAQKIVIGVRAPGVRVGARRLGLLSPRGESERNHGAPRAEKVEIAMA